MGARAYGLIQQYGDFKPGECVIEIGSEREEGSTREIARYCSRKRVPFYSVDVDPEVHLGAELILSGYKTSTAHLGRGEDFLVHSLKEQIRFAYLDGHDCIPVGHEAEPYIQFYKEKYKDLGLVLNNEMSQASHLIQAALVDIRSASRCAILIDDTDRTPDGWVGKGALAMPYLASRGYALFDFTGAALAVKE